MILSCPKCETQYFADDDSIGDSGRTVKCDACGHSWFVTKPEAESVSAKRAGAHEMYREKVRERRRRKSRFAAISAWATSSAVATVLLLSLVIFRTDVAALWPESASAYRLIGMDVNRFRVDFVDAEAERFFDGTTPILEVRGAVLNTSSDSVPAPRIRVSLLDDTGSPVAERYAVITQSSIPGRATADFSVRIENPPYEAFELDLSLAPANPGSETSATGAP